MLIVESVKKLVRREKYDSNTYIKYLRKKGISIGEECTIFVPTKTLIDIQNPYMIEIGNNVKIAEGVKILTHDFSWSVTCDLDGIITGSVGEVTIGNNVFIGMNTIITRNVRIGDNVIIGAGSVVTKDCENNYVYAGVPARKIMTIEEYHEKRKKSQLEDAKKVAIKYYEKTRRMPDEKILREFIFLFDDGCKSDKNVEKQILHDSGHYKKCYEAMKKNNPKFNGINDFLKYCNIIKR